MGVCLDMSVLLTTESNIFIGDKPDTPNNLICLYDTGGYDSEINMNKCIVERPTFMIKVRDTSYVNGLARCEVIKGLLTTLTNITINTHLYIEIFQVGGVNALGKDDKNRWEFSLNFKTRLIK